MTSDKTRLAALHRLKISKETEPEFDLLTKVAAELCQVPYAFISIVDEDTVWTKSAYGISNVVTIRDEDICNYTIKEEVGLEINDLTKNPITKNLPIAQPNSMFRCYMGANLRTEDGLVIGSLCILDSMPKTFNPNLLSLLSQLANQVMALFELKFKTEALRVAYKEMEYLANYDVLTNVFTRRKLLERFEQVKNELPDDQALFLVFIDLDHFKQINDNFGHSVGDEVLTKIGKLLSDTISFNSFVGRFGGEEFCLVMYGSDINGIKKSIFDLHSIIKNTIVSEKKISITASFGVASFTNEDDKDIKQIIKEADKAVYQAKTEGRNRIVYA